MFDYNQNGSNLVKMASPVVRWGWPKHIGYNFDDFDYWEFLNKSQWWL